MENATTDELQKISTLKLTITFFTTKLESLINETSATDENLLTLLSSLTDSIQAFVLAAKVVKTNHTIDSVVDKDILSCENIFSCLACNVQTGKTYTGVLNHVKTTKHIAHAKKFEKAKMQQPTSNNAGTSNLINPVPVALPHFSQNRQFEIKPKMSNHGMNSQLPIPNGKVPLPHLQNLQQQPVILPLPPIQGSVLLRPVVGVSELPMNHMQRNAIKNVGVNNYFNQLPDHQPLLDYKELFRMPLATNVVGFQQNVISPSNNYLRDFNRADEEPNQPLAAKKRRNRKQRRRSKSKNSNCETVEMEVKFLNENAIAYLKGDFESELVKFIQAAKPLSNGD